MTDSFKTWVSSELHLLALVEVSSLFDRAAYNALFEKEVRRLMQQFPDQQRLLTPTLSLDWIGYIAKSLRNAGFRDHDLDPLTHEVVVKLLVSPGGLFRNWDGQPLDARFKVAVRNAVINAAQKQMNQRRFPVVSVQQDVEPSQIAARSGVSDTQTIEAFRDFVRERLGYFGLAVLDLRLSGGDVKTFVGSDEFGRPTSYRIKNVVQSIKKLAEEFAQQQGDENFVRQVQRAMADEDQVVQRRVAGNRATRQALG